MSKLVKLFMPAVAFVALLSTHPLSAQETQSKTMPKVVYKVEAQYTAEAKAAKVAGTVGLKAIVDEHAIAQEIQVTRSLDAKVDQKAIDAVKQWRFVPGTADGKISAVSVNIEINFKLQ